MAAFQVLKPAVCLIAISQSGFSGKSKRFWPEFDGRRNILRLQARGRISIFRAGRRLRVRCATQEADNQSNGEEPPESLFMKELQRRGMSPTSLLEDDVRSDYGVDSETKEEEKAFSKRNTVTTEANGNLSNQREQSMLLNSEGLEGLIPRAKLLLTLGGTFFFGFWPLILTTIASFCALYLYFGSALVHDASTTTPISPPQYVDPYALLEDERISQMAPRLN